MLKLPILSGKDLIWLLKKLGYEEDYQTGSHIILRNKVPPYRRITIPNHKQIAKGTIRAIIRQTGLSRQEFLKLIES